MRNYLLACLFLIAFLSGLVAEGITINEVYYTVKNNNDKTQWIELYNNSSTAIDMSGWKISASKDPNTGFLIPGGTVINPKSFLVFVASAEVMASLWGLNNNVIEYGDALTYAQSGDDIHIFDTTDKEIDAVWYGDGGEMGSTNAANPVSFGMSLARSPDGKDTDNPSQDFYEHFPTPGQSNSFTGFSQSTWGKIKAIYSIKKKLFGT